MSDVSSTGDEYDGKMGSIVNINHIQGHVNTCLTFVARKNNIRYTVEVTNYTSSPTTGITLQTIKLGSLNVRITDAIQCSEWHATHVNWHLYGLTDIEYETIIKRINHQY
jgi:hypothetical protein